MADRRFADNGAETQGVQGGRSLPLPDRDVQRRVGWLRTGNDGVDAPSRRHRDAKMLLSVSRTSEGGGIHMEEVTIIGIDLAKRSFQVHRAKADGSVAYRRKLSRGKPLGSLASQPPCTVAAEAGRRPRPRRSNGS